MPSNSCPHSLYIDRDIINYVDRLPTVGCGYVGCDINSAKHCQRHAEEVGHAIFLHLPTKRSWCFHCHCEVTSIFEQEEMDADEEGDSDVSYDDNDIDDDSMDYDPPVNYSHRPKQPPLIVEDKTLDNISQSSKSSESLDDIGQLKPRGLCGLSNLGNTCYISAALQAMSNCVPLTQYCLECEKYIARIPVDSIAKRYCKLIQDMWSKKRNDYVTPTEFVQSVKKANPLFRGSSQQDAHEFLRCILNLLHEETKLLISGFSLDDGKSSIDTNRGISVKRTATETDKLPNPDNRLVIAINKTCKDDTNSNKSNDTNVVQKCKDLIEEDYVEVVLSEIESESSASTGEKFLQDEAKKENAKDPQDELNMEEINKLTNTEKEKTKKVTKVTVPSDLPRPTPGKRELSTVIGNQSYNPCAALAITAGEEERRGMVEAIWDWFKGWIWGSVPLEDCLSTFFEEDELKGDNMYNCEKCKKLRNGIKYSKITHLPEILCLHLKRFKHDSYSTSKINCSVNFPLTGLEMKSFLNTGHKIQSTTYDLVAIISHHGAAGGGHYVCYALNCINHRWYEYDDINVTEVADEFVLSVEAYVLFYRKSSTPMLQKDRSKIAARNRLQESSTDFVYISKQWYQVFLSCSEPGPITNTDLLCPHGAAYCANPKFDVNDFAVKVPLLVWNELRNKYGGGPKIQASMVETCQKCQEIYQTREEKRKKENEYFMKLKAASERDTAREVSYCISYQWFRKWQGFVRCETLEPPGPISNETIVTLTSDGKIQLRTEYHLTVILLQGADYGYVSKEAWLYLYGRYGGGPEIPQDCV
ncbi:uncharacterized protein TRIADDRAFT_53214 [Trichoplax adhaerens]|uniref:Ubiquitin carboxyl-terminal hydrolase n=1 Tax=Trichoplax adhaerens TaxID=10228 RepID=B3RNM1_TRIAD|nr:hypothetical protein TRIADDRAFT_53214 [Trichoplax adhaerens]EDV27481.1 hypothetical protein TRIADDRAFT_53214 [Trichoplax adhaerens]|eukprot:XP_002109315.1 hypothetical protein TRIADDRAFT_53214 [Trichoplax adhaerens]